MTSARSPFGQHVTDPLSAQKCTEELRRVKTAAADKEPIIVETNRLVGQSKECLPKKRPEAVQSVVNHNESAERLDITHKSHSDLRGTMRSREPILLETIVRR
jgi:hypothetical protein